MKDGRLVALFPLDEVAWTEDVSAAFSKMAAATSSEASPPVLALTGSLTPMADAEIVRTGWSVQKVH